MISIAINRHDVPVEGAEKFKAVAAASENGTTIKFSTVTRAFDKKYYEDKGGQHMAKGSAEYKALQKAATVRGFRNFTAKADGKLYTKGPSGEEIEGRTEVNNWLPSD